MDFNLPPKVRQALYILSAVATPVVAYLGTQNKIDAFYVGLYAVIATAVNGLAALNVSNK